MILTCWLGVHQWRVDYYTTIIDTRRHLIERISCARCNLLRSKSDIAEE